MINLSAYLYPFAAYWLGSTELEITLLTHTWNIYKKSTVLEQGLASSGRGPCPFVYVLSMAVLHCLSRVETIWATKPKVFTL